MLTTSTFGIRALRIPWSAVDNEINKYILPPLIFLLFSF
jgi:hypothetical protein